MANNYFQFSEHLVFKSEKAAQLFSSITMIAELSSMGDFDPYDPDDVDDEYKDDVAAFMGLPNSARNLILSEAECYGTFGWETDKSAPTTVWVYSDESGSMELAAQIAQVVLQEVKDNETVFTLTGADYCSKLRLGEFGGSWVVVSAEHFDGGSTWGAAEEAKKKMQVALNCAEKK
jgi:hypothetical protein